MIDIERVKESLIKVGKRMFITKEEHKQWCETISKEPYEMIKEFQEVKQGIDELERLQQKETPMKVIHLLPHQCQVVVKCPKCKCMMGVDDRSSYCSSCGQHLDWSDEK